MKRSMPQTGTTRTLITPGGLTISACRAPASLLPHPGPGLATAVFHRHQPPHLVPAAAPAPRWLDDDISTGTMGLLLLPGRPTQLPPLTSTCTTTSGAQLFLSGSLTTRRFVSSSPCPNDFSDHLASNLSDWPEAPRALPASRSPEPAAP
eukprot:759083-Hanusia_phi.AAC.3